MEYTTWTYTVASYNYRAAVEGELKHVIGALPKLIEDTELIQRRLITLQARRDAADGELVPPNSCDVKWAAPEDGDTVSRIAEENQQMFEWYAGVLDALNQCERAAAKLAEALEFKVHASCERRK